MILLSLLLQAAPPTQDEVRFEQCADIATASREEGEKAASAWRLAGGGFLAQQCLGLAYATGSDFAGAATAFSDAARAAETARDPRAANYWAQAGNAWLAAKDAVKARRALDAALAAGTLSGLALGEAHLDRARAAFAANDPTAARTDIDQALRTAADDPLAWLLSATLARRAGDLPRAAADLAEALKRSPDDASVQLELGNLAALKGDAEVARAAWSKAVELGGTGPVADAAKSALTQFAAGK